MKRFKSLIFILSLGLNLLVAIYFSYRLWNNNTNSQPASNEYDYWMDRDHYFELLPKDSMSIVFIGTSLTHNFEIEEAFRIAHIQNRGINGDDIEGMINRIDPIIEQQPRAIIIEGGINDLADNKSNDWIISRLNELIDRILKKTDNSCEISVISILPVANKSITMPSYCTPEMNAKIVRLNAKINELCTKRGSLYIDAYSAFAKNKQMPSLLTTDGVHLSGEGYLKLTSVLHPILKKYQ